MQQSHMIYPFNLNRIAIVLLLIISKHQSFGQENITKYDTLEWRNIQGILKNSNLLLDSSDIFLMQTVYNDNGIISRCIFINGSKEGLLTEFYENGHIKRVFSYLKNCLDGPFAEFSENGTLVTFGKYKCLNPDTLIIERKKIIDEATGDFSIMNHAQTSFSVKEGEWLYFNFVGIIERKEFWKDGVCISNSNQN